MKGKIVGGEFQAAPLKITDENGVTHHPHSPYFEELGFKRVEVVPVELSPYFEYETRYEDKGEVIRQTEVGTLKSDTDMQAARKAEIVRRIREKYDADDEMAILRQQTTKSADYMEYCELAERAKREVDAEIDKLKQ